MHLATADRELLVAALGPAPEAERAWQRWRARHSLDAAPWPQARLFTLIGHRLRAAEIPDPDLDRLMGAQRHAWARGVATARDAIDATRVLAAAGVPCMVLKGVGMQYAYPSPGLRAMGDADLLVRESDALTAVAALAGQGWDLGRLSRPRIAHLLLGPKGVVARRAGRELDLHWRPVHDLPSGVDGDLWTLQRERTTAGGAVHTPSPSHQLVVVLAHGLRDGSDAALQGLCDAVMLIRTGECDAASAAHLAAQWQRLATLRAGIALLRRLIADEQVEAFGAALDCQPRPKWRDRVGHRARTMAPGRASLALHRLARSDLDRAHGAGTATDPPRLATFAPGKVVELRRPKVSATIARAGWSGIEDWGRWTDGTRALLVFQIAAQQGTTTWPVSFWVHSHLGRHGRQRVGVRVDGRRVAVWRWRGAPTARKETLMLPTGRPVEIEFRIRCLAPVGPVDRRLLGLALQWFRIEPEWQ